MLWKALLSAVTVALLATAAFAQDLIVNGDFESNPPPPLAMGNNLNRPILPWMVISSGQINVVQVDGPGGYNYQNNGPESDATAPGAGVPQHYLDLSAAGTVFQTFVPRCSGDVQFGASFSTRADQAGKASLGLYGGTYATGNTSLLPITTVSLPAGTSQTTPWTPVTFAAPVTKGLTYSLVVEMDNNINVDNVFARYTRGCGTLKVCKVAGLGVPVGTPFTFTAGGNTFTVPAGPPPGGTCVIGPSAPAGTIVTVSEVIPPHHVVSNIDVVPPSQIVGTANLATGSVDVTMGAGVTEVTFTDKRTGFLEICKQGPVRGNFTFSVTPGALGPYVVPAGACSPAIEVPAGTITITEIGPAGADMSGCSTIPPSQQGPCDPKNHTSAVTVAPGDVSTQTIAIIHNRRELEPNPPTTRP